MMIYSGGDMMVAVIMILMIVRVMVVAVEGVVVFCGVFGEDNELVNHDDGTHAWWRLLHMVVVVVVVVVARTMATA